MKLKLNLLISFVFVALCSLCISPNTEAGVCQGVAIPAYFYPGTLWTTSIASPRTAIMIMNPDNGPGASKDVNYVNVVTSAHAAGVKVLGYVHTNYGDRPIQEVKSEINLYKQWYGVDGIFLDEASSITADLAYYQAVANYIRAGKGGFVMLNPGSVPASQSYIKLADTTVVFEETYDAYQTWVPPSWIYNYPANKFAHLVHTTPSKLQMINAVGLSKLRNAGFVYVTDDVENNPWDSLPSYWQTELNTMATCYN